MDIDELYGAYRDETLPTFEKIFRRKRKRKKNDVDIMAISIGGIYYVDDSKVRFEGKRKEFHRTMRPGVVCKLRREPNRFEAKWVPGSHLIGGRNEAETVFLDSAIERVPRDTVLLLKYSQWYKPLTLGKRMGKLSYGKTEEMQRKCEALENG